MAKTKCQVLQEFPTCIQGLFEHLRTIKGVKNVSLKSFSDIGTGSALVMRIWNKKKPIGMCSWTSRDPTSVYYHSRFSYDAHARPVIFDLYDPTALDRLSELVLDGLFPERKPRGSA